MKNKKNKRRKHRNKKKKIIIIILIVVLFILSIILGYLYNKKITTEEHNRIVTNIKKHYDKKVITNKNAKTYILKNNNYQEIGTISKNINLEIDNKENITWETLYFKITNLDEEYYIKYQDVDVSKEEIPSSITNRYKNYIPFNQNIITKDKTNFYDENGTLLYTINKSYNFPIIIKEDNQYGIEFLEKLLYIKKDDVKETVDNSNTDKTNTSGITVLNYHFFYDDSNPDDICNQTICLSTSMLREHLQYIKDNNIFTPTLKELEMYIDGKIQLPKSVVLTIDDGWRAEIGSKVITEYKVNATIFLMSYYYDPRTYQNEYIEVHSHGHDIHNPGACPYGQGGAIQCLDRDKLLEDLNASREKLNNTTYFCYPFYEFNDYSISVLKEAGFTMAFGGPYENGYRQVMPGIDKYRLPRSVIYITTGVEELKYYID